MYLQSQDAVEVDEYKSLHATPGGIGNTPSLKKVFYRKGSVITIMSIILLCSILYAIFWADHHNNEKLKRLYN